MEGNQGIAQELHGSITPLADALFSDGVPGSGTLDQLLLNTKIE